MHLTDGSIQLARDYNHFMCVSQPVQWQQYCVNCAKSGAPSVAFCNVFISLTLGWDDADLFSLTSFIYYVFGIFRLVSRTFTSNACDCLMSVRTSASAAGLHVCVCPFVSKRGAERWQHVLLPSKHIPIAYSRNNELGGTRALCHSYIQGE